MITGGTKEDRETKYRELYRTDQTSSVGDYRSGEEIVIIFGHHKFDYELTFDEAKAITGSQQLGSKFKTTYGDPYAGMGVIYEESDSRFGIIDVTPPENTSSFGLK